MSISAILEGIPSLKKLQGTSNDDWVDRLNHVWTVFVTIFFAICVTTGQIYGDPIECFCRGDCADNLDYVKTYCWTKNTYYFHIEEDIPREVEERKDAELTYYQWVPVIFLFMSLLFKFPNILWRLFNGGSGINLNKIVDMSEETQLGSPEDRDKTITHISIYMDRWLESNREYKWNKMVHARQTLSRFCCFFCNKRAGKYLTSFYLFIKMTYLANVISQFFILNKFLATDYNMYGFELLDRLRGVKKHWDDSRQFPVTTLCDVQFRQFVNVQPWTAQCVLPMNLYNQKIFAFIWFWLVLVSTVTALNTLSWLYRIVLKRNRASYIKKYLTINTELRGEFDQDLCQKFADEYLRDDGVFVLRVIAKNSSELVVSDLIHKLWKQFKDTKSKRDDGPAPALHEPRSRSNDVEKGTLNQRLYMFEGHKK